jgi:orotate phosphoribosyltransferase
MASTTDRLVQILLDTHSFKSSPVPTYHLASGVLSQFYIDCKLALSYPEARQLVGKLIYDRVRSLDFDAVGGLLIGAYPIAIAVSDAAHSSGKTILAFGVRKDAKEHGLKKVIEGDVSRGQRVLIVDDVITSGKSTIEAIRKCRQEGLEVLKAIALIDRQEQDGRRNIEAEGVTFEALFTLDQLRSFKAPSRMAT